MEQEDIANKHLKLFIFDVTIVRNIQHLISWSNLHKYGEIGELLSYGCEGRIFVWAIATTKDRLLFVPIPYKRNSILFGSVCMKSLFYTNMLWKTLRT